MKSDTKTYTTFYISKICDVYPTTVANWIDEGKLKAFTTPGGHRRVRAKDLKEFLEKYNIPISDELVSEGRKKILVVDDDKIVLDSIVGVLQYKKKYKIFKAVDGFQAGQAVSEHEPDLIILDIMLPGMDGFEVCKTIRKKNKQVKIIAVTGYNTEENKNKILACGANAYMAKPFEMAELLKKIDDLLKV
ncbi:MAG: response regulator [bacterium]